VATRRFVTKTRDGYYASPRRRSRNTPGRIEATLPSGAPTSVGAPDGFLKRKPRWQSRVSNDETRAVVMAQAFYIQPETLLPAGV